MFWYRGFFDPQWEFVPNSWPEGSMLGGGPLALRWGLGPPSLVKRFWGTGSSTPGCYVVLFFCCLTNVVHSEGGRVHYWGVGGTPTKGITLWASGLV